MDYSAILEPVLGFFREGIGKTIADAVTFIYRVLYPANSPTARPVLIPE